ncbi:hypothetical protein EC179100_2809 [Escherichia coli 179100]|nr:hypothetical protein EC179100_2809 [Escherichia coli 179100]
MTTITKERIELFIKNPLENGLTRGEQMELARIALASLEADPVKRVNSDQMRRVCLEANRHLDKYDAMAKEVNKLLGRIAPPAPVVPEEATPENVEMLSGYVSTYKLTDSERDIAAEIWNACRAAMLHSAEPASNHEELPLDYLQGQKDGLEWAAQLAEANHPQTGDWLYDDPLELAKAIRKGPDMPEFDGPTPVTPDGWISCSERMPDTKTAVLVAKEFDRKGDWRMKWATYIPGHPDANDGWIIPGASWKPSHWMPLPEPPQEVNRG